MPVLRELNRSDEVLDLGTETGLDVILVLHAASEHHGDLQPVTAHKEGGHHREEQRHAVDSARKALGVTHRLVHDEVTVLLARLHVEMHEFEERLHLLRGTLEGRRVEAVEHPSLHLDAALSDVDDLSAPAEFHLRQVRDGLERIVERERILPEVLTILVSRLFDCDHQNHLLSRVGMYFESFVARISAYFQNNILS